MNPCACEACPVVGWLGGDLDADTGLCPFCGARCFLRRGALVDLQPRYLRERLHRDDPAAPRGLPPSPPTPHDRLAAATDAALDAALGPERAARVRLGARAAEALAPVVGPALRRALGALRARRQRRP